MPMRDGTGPMGMGPMTGRGCGSCGWGLGWRGRQAGGRGLGRYYGICDIPQSKDDRKKALAEYRDALEEELEDIQAEEKKLDAKAD